MEIEQQSQEQTEQKVSEQQNATPENTESTGAENAGQNVETSVESTEAKPTKMIDFLDSLTDGGKKTEEENPNASAAEPVVVNEGEQQADALQAKTPEQEEAELLEGVKSERGKDRIKQVFTERKQLEQDLTEFKQLVQSTGMTPQDFAQSLEFGRLVNSGEENNLRVALEMIEQQRTMLYAKLGVEAPGVDLLAGHDDLKASVDNMEITRDKAVELAKYRKQQADVSQRQQMQQQTAQERQQFDEQVKQAATAMETYLATRANEVDHPARLKMISEHFQKPANLQSFIETYQPHQWAATVKMMYDGIAVPKQPATQQSQPIRSRPANLGNPDASAIDPIDRVAQRMQAMGL